MAKQGPPAFEEMLATQRDQMMDMYARAIAGVQGKPPASEKATDDDEYEAWTREDPNVTPEMLAKIAQQTIQEFAQQTNEDGSPLWNDEQIGRAVAARQTAARYPFRHLTYTVGAVDLEDQIKRAKAVRKRVESRQQREMGAMMQASGWQEVDPTMPMGEPSRPQLTGVLAA